MAIDFQPETSDQTGIDFQPEKEAPQPRFRIKPTQDELRAQLLTARNVQPATTLGQLPSVLFTPSDETIERARQQVATHTPEAVDVLGADIGPIIKPTTPQDISTLTGINPASRSAKIASAAISTPGQIANSFATPEGALMLASPAAGAAFVAQMATHVPAKLGEAAGAYSAGDKESGDAALVDGLVTAGLLALPAVHAIKYGKRLEDVVGDQKATELRNEAQSAAPTVEAAIAQNGEMQPSAEAVKLKEEAPSVNSTPEVKEPLSSAADILEMAPDAPKLVLQPAIKIGNEILTGGGVKHANVLLSHAFDQADGGVKLISTPEKELEAGRGFIDQNGKFYTRAEAAATGIFGDKAPQSENLPGFDENATPPPMRVIPVESEKPLNPGGSQENLPADKKAISEANNAPDAWAQMRAEVEKKKSAPAPSPEIQGNPEPAESVPTQEKNSGSALPAGEGANDLPETITGSNEEKASEMPAEAGGSPAPAKSPTAGEGSGVYGIAKRVREQRNEAGQVGDVPVGEGTAAPDSVEHGRQLLSSGADPESALTSFEQTKRFNADDVAIVRAHGEQLAKAAESVKNQFGRKSNQYKAAYDALTDWDARSKKIQTEWSESGRAQQGATNIDTGTFTGLQRAKKSISGRDFTPAEATKAEEIAGKVSKANSDAVEASKNLYDALDKETADPKEQAVPPHVRLVADRLIKFLETEAGNALKRIQKRRAEGRLFTGIDPVELADYATYGALKIAKHGIRGAEMTANWAKEMTDELGDYIKPHLKKIWEAAQDTISNGIKKYNHMQEPEQKVRKAIISENSGGAAEKRALAAASKTVREAAARAAKAETDASKKQSGKNKTASQVQLENAKKAMAAANKTVTEAAARAAKAETDASKKQSGKNKTASQVQLENAKKAMAAANKTVTEAAARAAEAENRARIDAAQSTLEPGTLKHAQTEFYRYKGGAMDADQIRALWLYAKKQYLEKGVDNFNEIRNKVATDLGLKVDDVSDGLAQPKGVKRLTDEAYIKSQNARRLQETAKRFVAASDAPPISKAIPAAARFMFGAKVFGHGMVAFGTHAPVVAFQPQHWASYIKGYGKMAKMVVNRAYYERQAQDLMLRKNYVTAKRAGLVNDPYKVEDFNNPQIAQYFGALSGAGNRGYFALKLLRQDMFDQAWNKLPETAQIPEVATAIADGINHATGVIKAGSGAHASLALFAPKLLASRAAWLAVDPAKAVATFTNWKNASAADKMFAINQVKEKATVLATLAGLLAANQAILSATGSKQKINTNDPFKSDFLKFKGAGMNFAYGNPMLSMIRLPIQLYKIRQSDGGKAKNLIFPDESTYTILGKYGRSQLSPLASLLTTLAFKSDYENRPLPNSTRPVPKRLAAQGVKPYTWPEFWSDQFLPIPAEEATREVWKSGFGSSPKELAALRKAMATIAVMSLTGGRLTEDIPYKK